MTNAFVKKTNLVSAQLKIHFKSILIFAIISLLAAFLVILITYSVPLKMFYKGHLKPPVIGPLEVSYYEIDASLTRSVYTSIHTMMHFVYLNAPQLVILSMIALYYINVCYSKEIQTGQIGMWLTTPKSKLSVMIGKILFINSVLLIILAPQEIVIFFYALAAVDAKVFFGDLFLAYFKFTCLIMMLTTIYLLIATCFHEKGMHANFISVAIICYIFISWLVLFFNEAETFPELDIFVKIKFLYPQSLLYGGLDFNKPGLVTIIENHEGYDAIKFAQRTELKGWLVAVSWIVILDGTINIHFSKKGFYYLRWILLKKQVW